MFSNSLAGAVFTTGIWIAFAFAMAAGTQLNPQADAWGEGRKPSNPRPRRVPTHCIGIDWTFVRRGLQC
jgi:hypothetical protein